MRAFRGGFFGTPVVSILDIQPFYLSRLLFLFLLLKQHLPMWISPLCFFDRRCTVLHRRIGCSNDKYLSRSEGLESCRTAVFVIQSTESEVMSARQCESSDMPCNGDVKPKVASSNTILGNSLKRWREEHPEPLDPKKLPKLATLSKEERQERLERASRTRTARSRLLSAFSGDADAASTRQLDLERTGAYSL